MNEPTVLDYIKSIFKDWRSFTAFLQAWFERADTTQLVEVSEPAPVMEAPAPEMLPVETLKPGSFPWASIGALLLALIAQSALEPLNQYAPPTAPSFLSPLYQLHDQVFATASLLSTIRIPLYLAAFGLALWAFLRGEWTPAPLPAGQANVDPLTIRSGTFILSLAAGATAFVMMSDNKFTGLNLSVWALAIFLHVRAFWLKEPQSLWKKMINVFSRFVWTKHTAMWGLLVAAVVALTLFFRLYHLSQVPLEMTSDHAEKLMDVWDIRNGIYSIFFPRNTGREPLYIHLSAFMAGFTGISFLTIKIVAVLGGLAMLPYLYLLGKELGSERIGLLAVAFAGIAYWPNVIERFGLRISFYPLFVAPTLYYLIRGLRLQRRNDFILAGLALGLGLNGYTPFRIMPIAVVVIVTVYLLHKRNKQIVKQTLLWLGLLALTSLMLFIPLARYATEHPDVFGYRAFSRLGSVERPLPGPIWQLFLGNLWNALKEFNWNNGNIWVHSIPNRPALDVVAGALFLLGALLVLARYVRSRHWADLTLLLAVPLTQMPSILSLAFPAENPSMNRTAGAIVPVFLLVGIGLDGLMTGLGRRPEPVEGSGKWRRAIAWGLAGILLVLSSIQNYDLVFRQYNEQYAGGAWNTSEMGAVMKEFMHTQGPSDNVWIVPYPFWVDTRLPPIWAGVPGRDMAIPRDKLMDTVGVPGPKLFMVAIDDTQALNLLQALYPQGQLDRYSSALPQHDFWIYTVPASP